jgi:hypothetical protein
MYPHADKLHEYGMAYPMCVLLQKIELTRQRTKMLDKMLNPIEGDACDAGLRYPKTAPSQAEKSFPYHAERRAK